MNFENERGLFTDRARIIRRRRLVGGADFTQLCTARFQNFTDPKTSADLDQFAARNDHFVRGPDGATPSNKVMNDQNERSCAIVDDGGGLSLAEDSEGALEITAAVAPVAAGKVELE